MFRSLILFVVNITLCCTTTISTVNQSMAHYDLTKDWKVDNTELRTVAYMDHKLPPIISDEVDRNDDKFIDRTEIIAATTLIQRHVAKTALHWLKDHDMNGDGLLNEVELFESIYMELGLSMKDINGCFRENDVNKDGYLTSVELVETLHCSRLLALEEAKELLKIYDIDGDNLLDMQEAQILAIRRYDIEPTYATVTFDDVSHRVDRKINELELIDFLTKLRKEAAIAALNKLSGLDQNGDKAVSFNELLRGYERQLGKFILKKIFNKVDVNKNAYINPIEFLSLQNLIADEIHLQTTQNDLNQQNSVNQNVTKSLPSLVISRFRKKSHNEQRLKQRKRRADSEVDKKLTVNDETHPGLRELTAINASSVHFSTMATAVPRFMESSKQYQKFFPDGAKLISETFTSSKKVGSSDMLEVSNIKQTRKNLISDKNTLPLIRELTPVENNQQKIDSGNNAKNQEETLVNSPNVAYMKKFGKFFDFLEKAIKKISEVVEENNRKQAEGLKSPVRGINITKHSSKIANKTSNIDINRVKKTTENSGKTPSVLTPTTTEKLKIQKNPDEVIYGKNHDEKNFIVHTPIDLSGYKTVGAKRFSESFDTPFLQLDEKEEEVKEIKMINYGRAEHGDSRDENSLHDQSKKNDGNSEIMNKDDCVLENQVDSSNLTNHSEQSTGAAKRYKCNIEAQTLKAVTRLLKETSENFQKKLPSQDKSLNKSNSLGNETILSLLKNNGIESSFLKKEDEPSLIRLLKQDTVKEIKMIPEAENDQESGKKTSTKYVNLNKLPELATTNSTKTPNDVLNATNQASTVSNSENQRKKYSYEQKTNTETSFKLEKNDSVLQIPKTSSKPLIISSTVTLQPLTNSNDESAEVHATQSFFLINHEDEEEQRIQANLEADAEIVSVNINQTSGTHLQNNNLSIDNMEIVKALSEIILNTEKNAEKQYGEANGLIQEKRKKYSQYRKGYLRKYHTEDNNSVENNGPTTNTTDIICDKGKLCKLRKKYRSKLCSRLTSLTHSIETSENSNSTEQKNETGSFYQVNQSEMKPWRTERIEDLLLQAIQEYQTFLSNQEKKKEEKLINK